MSRVAHNAKDADIRNSAIVARDGDAGGGAPAIAGGGGGSPTVPAGGKPDAGGDHDMFGQWLVEPGGAFPPARMKIAAPDLKRKKKVRFDICTF
jgi:hypothetical protein